MAEADRPWPDYVYVTFRSAIAQDIEDGIEEDTFFGPMMRLCYNLFYADEGPYNIIPQFRPKGIDFVPAVLVEVDQHPVFFLEIKSPLSLPDELKRQEADEQMRRKFKELGPLLEIPKLYGVSAFGTRFAFYEYDRATRDIQPTQPDPTAEVAPIKRWDFDVLEKEGADRLKDIVERVKDMCARI